MYERVRRINPQTFEPEVTFFKYRVVDMIGTRLYVDEQTSTVVLDPFKFEGAMYQ